MIKKEIEFFSYDMVCAMVCGYVTGPIMACYALNI